MAAALRDRCHLRHTSRDPAGERPEKVRNSFVGRTAHTTLRIHAPPIWAATYELRRPNLDVYSGLAGLYRKRHGNLRTDGVEVVLSRALAHGCREDDALWFDFDRPLPSELANRHGNPAGLCVHPSSRSVRYVWLDRAKRTGLADRT